MRNSIKLLSALLALSGFASESAESKDLYVYGNWAADCSQRGRDVVCERYSGFFNGGLPSNCEIGNRLICRGVHICNLITYIYIIDPNNPGVSKPSGVGDCWDYDTVAGRPVLR
ncbi:hypothetical protein O9X98_06870 [Agrobacterium salinitolerans]|nr:hypothetical protein [Agrobacterium salinitolerans]